MHLCCSAPESTAVGLVGMRVDESHQLLDQMKPWCAPDQLNPLNPVLLQNVFRPKISKLHRFSQAKYCVIVRSFQHMVPVPQQIFSSVLKERTDLMLCCDQRRSLFSAKSTFLRWRSFHAWIRMTSPSLAGVLSNLGYHVLPHSAPAHFFGHFCRTCSSNMPQMQPSLKHCATPPADCVLAAKKEMPTIDHSTIFNSF